jgi:inhibitor of cysteine peptidase
MKTIKFALLMTLLAGLLLSACQTRQPAGPPVVGTPPSEDGYAYGQEATVESLDVLLLDSFPLQVNVLVSGYLPDGCVELVEITAERQENEFILTLTTRRQTGDIACTEALVPFEERISLDVYGLEAGTYTVTAQDQQATFTFDVDNVPAGEPVSGDQDVVFTSDAVVEDISVLIMESDPVQVQVLLAGYLPDGCTTVHEVQADRKGDTFTVRIVTQRPDGDVACTMAIVPFDEQVDLDVAGLPAGEYTVRAGELRETITLDTDN